MHHLTRPAAALAVTLLLGACSSATPPAANAPAQANASGAATPPPALPKPDANTPDQAYVPLDTALQVLALESALSTPKYDLMARASSSDYRSTQDSFKQHDLLKTLQPKFDSAIAAAKAHPYITWISAFPQIGHYDFNTHAFHVGSGLFEPDGASQFYQDGQPYARISVKNGADFRVLHVSDETKARAMEPLVSKMGGLRLKVFAFAQGTDDSGTPTLETTITKVQVLDTHDQVLFEQAAP